MMEKSSTRSPSSGAVVPSACITTLLSRKPKTALRDQAPLYLVGTDGNDPHQGMAQVLLEPPVVDRARHLLRERAPHAEDVERGLAEALHQLAGEHLADR